MSDPVWNNMEQSELLVLSKRHCHLPREEEHGKDTYIGYAKEAEIHHACNERYGRVRTGHSLPPPTPSTRILCPTPSAESAVHSLHTNDGFPQLVPGSCVVSQPVSSPASRRGECGAGDDDPSLSCHLLHSSGWDTRRYIEERIGKKEIEPLPQNLCLKYGGKYCCTLRGKLENRFQRVLLVIGTIMAGIPIHAFHHFQKQNRKQKTTTTKFHDVMNTEVVTKH